MILGNYENLVFSPNDLFIISITSISLAVKRFKIIAYVKRNFDSSVSPFVSIIYFIVIISGNFDASFIYTMTFPFSSRPLLPYYKILKNFKFILLNINTALPLIYVYSLLFKYLNSNPSFFYKPKKITVFAGILTPIANVSVANRTLTKPSE